MFKWNILSQGIIYYCLIMFLIYVLSDYFLFPSPKSSYHDKDLNIVKLKTDDNKEISALYLKNSNARFTVLFSHGNAEDLGDLFSFLNHYRDQGFSILAYDYHGYGTSTGKSSETNSYLDIFAAYRYLTQTLQIPAENIILHGRSLGSGPTLELATTKLVRAVILENAMLTAFQILTIIPLFPLDKYRNSQKITKLSVPILIIHATKDAIIPFWHGKKLYEIANAPKYFLPIEGASHNDILLVGELTYWQAIRKFAAEL